MARAHRRRALRRRPRFSAAGAVATLVLGLLAVPVAPAGAIVNGRESELGDWPWQVALLGDGGQRCGGVIVAPDLVVTAAHCAEASDAASLTVVAGSIDLRRDGGQERDITSVEVHEDYDPETAQNDLALLTLDESFALDDAVAPVALPGPEELELWKPGDIATVTGFGALDEDEYGSPVLREVEVEIYDDDACAAAYLEDGDDDVAGGVNLCAGREDGSADSCFGDSGGPLVVADEAGASHYLVGLVSWGAGCAVPGRPTVHTEITAFLTWLAERGVGGIDAPTRVDGAVANPVRIPASGTVGKAERFPLSVDVAGIDGPVTDVDVELRGLTHDRVEDLDVWLVGPDGTVVTLLSGVDAGAAEAADLTIDGAGAAPGGGRPLTGGRWHPASGASAGGARQGPEAPADLDALTGLDPVGRWRLLVADSGGPSHGALEGWTLVLR
ncbi:MAG: trypsin-like serine protease [Actinomycetota bacterium]|nr:trypsin-like serine protease [Actinomycetota bacterium]